MIVRKLSSVLIFAAVILATSCGKDQPAPPQVTNQPEAQDYFKKFQVNRTANGHAQYARSTEIAEAKGVKAKVNLFLFPDATYGLEYFQQKGKTVTGAFLEGKWFANENKQLVLLDKANNRIAVGTPIQLPNGAGGIKLAFEAKVDLRSANNKLAIVPPPKDGWTLHYTPEPTARNFISPDLKKSLGDEMALINEGRKELNQFPD